jgi:GT2 family glycosyltransferase
MKTLPTVSVCIANYNGMDVIDACIDSVLVQDCDFAVEIIVHDDASTDGSAQHIRKKNPGIKLLESTENVGFCVANNRMAAAATGQYLLLLNNDAELYLDALSTLCKTAQISGQPAILSLPQYNWGTGELIDIGSLLDPFLNPIPNKDPQRDEVGFVIGACLWIPRTLWHELGGFPEWFGSIAEDLYLCCAARIAGYPVRVTGESGYRHWVGRSFGGGKVSENRLVTTYRRRALSERNKTFVMVIIWPSPLFCLVWPVHLLLLLLEAALLTVLKFDGTLAKRVYFPVFKALIERRTQLREERRKLQARKTREGVRAFLSVCRWWPHKLTLLFRHGLPRIS